MIGLDRIGGYFDASAVVDGWTESGRPLGTIPQITAADLASSLRHGGVTLVDVRNDQEWAAGHIDGARHVPLGRLAGRLDQIPRERPIVLQCAAGARSAIAASLLRLHGIDRVSNLIGGIGAWTQAGLPVV